MVGILARYHRLALTVDDPREVLAYGRFGDDTSFAYGGAVRFGHMLLVQRRYMTRRIRSVPRPWP